jgi:serine/threonine protein phosphatase PrpC
MPLTLHTYVVEHQGPRDYMEDTHVVCKVGIKNNMELLGVFDGHGGGAVSDACKKSFGTILTQNLLRFGGDLPVAIRATFQLMDQFVSINIPMTVGSTAAIVLVDKEKVHFANAGDSMSMIINKDGSFEMMSMEHKAADDDERQRIQLLGGYVFRCEGNVYRVNGNLNLSRSIGDHYMKKFIISDPYIKSTKTKKIKYIVVASDGIWDVYNAKSLTADILECFASFSNKQAALEELLRRTYTKGSMDNVTLMISEIIETI